jgi:hypothetical protein
MVLNFFLCSSRPPCPSGLKKLSDECDRRHERGNWYSTVHLSQATDILGEILYCGLTLWMRSCTVVWHYGWDLVLWFDIMDEILYCDLTLWMRSCTVVWHYGWDLVLWFDIMDELLYCGFSEPASPLWHRVSMAAGDICCCIVGPCGSSDVWSLAVRVRAQVRSCGICGG